MPWRHFTCEVCGHEISSLGGTDKRNVCQICLWLDDNEYLTDDERDKLREKLTIRDDSTGHA